MQTGRFFILKALLFSTVGCTNSQPNNPAGERLKDAPATAAASPNKQLPTEPLSPQPVRITLESLPKPYHSSTTQRRQAKLIIIA
jgi:hypothetical protein